ncbi:MAG: hypothetical protein ACRDTA_22830 [Pseudonocardiaceae bacterium]
MPTTLDLLDGSAGATVGTSVRLPGNLREAAILALREAAILAAELGLAASTTELTVRGLRDALEAFAQRAVLDVHYRSCPDVCPGLAEITLAAAEIDGHPLAARPDLVRRAAAEVGLVKDDPGPDDVLLYAAGLAAAVA